MSADDLDARVALVAERVDERLARFQVLLDAAAAGMARDHADELVAGAERLLGRRD